MKTPYTTKTGLRIGGNYYPDLHQYHDNDALKLQDALLKNKRQSDIDGIAIVIGCIACVVVVYAWLSA